MSGRFAVRRLPLSLVALGLFVGATSGDARAEAGKWTKLEDAVIEGRRWDTPVGYAPDLDRFLVLGGRTTYGDYRKPRSFDQLALDRERGAWENWYPRGVNWGPPRGACQAPAWKDERFHFRDAAGETRPNWTVYGTFSLAGNYAYDPRSKWFVFYAGGRTFRYDPAERTWADLAPPTDPQSASGGVLLWSSLCYDEHNQRFVLFGGGNVRTERGDPGTWTYSHADNAWQRLDLAVQPGPRANSRLVYDPVNRCVVLFGGDRLDQLLADTWTFDVVANAWRERKPPRGPSPRAGHALLWLPKAKKILLLGGHGYTSATGYVEPLYRRLPFEAWTYDVAANEWSFLKRFEPAAAPQGPANAMLPAAVDADDNVLAVADGAWLGTFDAAAADPAGAEQHGAPPGAVERRAGPHDPAWYAEAPPADAQASARELADLPANQWRQRATPRLARPNMDWGSAVFAPDHDQILRFSGGHSAYSGTAPLVYDVKTDRYALPFAPEYPVEYVYSNDQVDGEWSFGGNPWMTGHTYKSTGYDVNLRCLVFAPRGYTYFFDPLAGKWSRGPEPNPYRPNFYVVTVCSTPQGAVAWADKPQGGAGLWRLDAATRAWRPLPLTLPPREELPAKSADQHGMAYDSKRERLLLFSGVGANRGDVLAHDPRTGKAEWRRAAGKERAAAPSRETAYLPEADAVLVAARTTIEGRPAWLLYDCEANAWKAIELTGADPIGKGTQPGVFNNSLGLMYDPARKLVWAVGQNSHVHVLRLDLKTARIHAL